MLKSKNKAKSDKILQILIVLTVLLSSLYVISFTRSLSSADKREKVKTALVNQKYKDSINSILLQDASGCIELSLDQGFWNIRSLTQETSSIPASKERVNNLLEELIKVRNLYKISDKINKNSSLGLTNGTEFHIRYTYNSENSDKGSFRELIFGNQDFSLSSRYLMTGESTQVYEIDNSMDTYLTTSIQSWAEPYIISRTVSSTDIQNITAALKTEDGKKTIKRNKGTNENTDKLLELRHGGIPSESEIDESKNNEADLELEIENGNKSKIILEITQSKNQEGSYTVKVRYFKPDSKSAFYTSYSKISTWTYNKIKEITL